MKQKWIKKEGKGFVRVAEKIEDQDQKNLKSFVDNPMADSHDKKLVAEYKKRKHLNIKAIKSYTVSKGVQFAP